LRRDDLLVHVFGCMTDRANYALEEAATSHRASCAGLRHTPRGDTAAERGDVGDTIPERGEVIVERTDRYELARSDRGVPLALPSCATESPQAC